MGISKSSQEFYKARANLWELRVLEYVNGIEDFEVVVGRNVVPLQEAEPVK
jgi:hypothetical protein